MKRIFRFFLAFLTVGLFSALAWGTGVAPSATKKAATAKSDQPFTSTETLRGTITSVQISKGLMVVTDASGAPFDFQVAHAQVEVNGSPAKTTALKAQTGKQVTVKFLPFPTGDVAQRISI